MDLELKKESLANFEIAALLRGEREEITESIVPDSLPDILRIITTDGKVYLRQEEIRDEKVTLSGVAEVTAVYVAENGALKSLRAELPFLMEEACPKSAEKLRTNIWVEELSCHTLNPRKWQVKCRLQAEINVYEHRTENFCSCCAEEGERVECLQKTESAMLIASLAEKDFTYEDTLSLASGHGRVTDLLLARVNARVKETKTSANNTTVKGIYFADFLVAYENGYCETVSYELPFAQTGELDGGKDEAKVEAAVRLTGMDCKLFGTGENEQTVSLSLFTHLETTTVVRREFPVLGDLYSTMKETETEMREMHLQNAAETAVRRQVWQENAEVGTSAESILHIAASTGAVRVMRTDGGAELSTRLRVQIVYKTQEGKVLSAERYAEVKTEIRLPSESGLNCRAEVAAELSAVITGDGIAVRVPVDFFTEQREEKHIRYVHAARSLPEEESGCARKPSLVLRRREAGESLWSVAKRYRTTTDDILSANGCCTETELPSEKLLLIPKSR